MAIEEKTTGERIRELREAKHLTQNVLAEMIDSDGNTISRWERNKLGIGTANIAKLARALNTSTDYLLKKTSNPDSYTENSSVEGKPYTKNQSLNSGMLVLTFNNGEKLELPPTKASYDFLKEMTANAFRTVSVAVS